MNDRLKTKLRWNTIAGSRSWRNDRGRCKETKEKKICLQRNVLNSEWDWCGERTGEGVEAAGSPMDWYVDGCQSCLRKEFKSRHNGYVVIWAPYRRKDSHSRAEDAWLYYSNSVLKIKVKMQPILTLCIYAVRNMRENHTLGYQASNKWRRWFPNLGSSKTGALITRPSHLLQPNIVSKQSMTLCGRK